MNKEEQLEKIDSIALKTFKSINLDTKDSLNVSLLERVLKNISKEFKIPPPNEDEIQEILDEFDENRDGELQFSEFKGFIATIFTDTQNYAEEISPTKRNKRQSQSQQGFMSNVRDKHISIMDNSINFTDMMALNRRLSRVSTILKTKQDVLNFDVKYAHTPQHVSDKKQWNDVQIDKNRRISNAFESYKNIQRLHKDRYLQYSKVQYNPNTKISSIYTNLEPQKDESYLPHTGPSQTNLNNSYRKKSILTTNKRKSSILQNAGLNGMRKQSILKGTNVQLPPLNTKQVSISNIIDNNKDVSMNNMDSARNLKTEESKDEDFYDILEENEMDFQYKPKQKEANYILINGRLTVLNKSYHLKNSFSTPGIRSARY